MAGPMESRRTTAVRKTGPDIPGCRPSSGPTLRTALIARRKMLGANRRPGASEHESSIRRLTNRNTSVSIRPPIEPVRRWIGHGSRTGHTRPRVGIAMTTRPFPPFRAAHFGPVSRCSEAVALRPRRASGDGGLGAMGNLEPSATVSASPCGSCWSARSGSHPPRDSDAAPYYTVTSLAQCSTLHARFEPRHAERHQYPDRNHLSLRFDDDDDQSRRFEESSRRDRLDGKP